MKNIFKTILSLVLATTILSCSESDKVIDQVVDGTTNGAILRLISTNSNVLNRSDATTFWSVTVEEQDVEDGKLMESVELYVSLRDLSDGNGTTVAKDALVKTIPASDFSTGPLGLPRATISATFAEAEAAMGLDASKHAPGDLFVFETRLKLTNGQTFGAADAGGIITGGFFSSPYVYNAALVCSPKPGDYKIDMRDTWGDGWQTSHGSGGTGITITLTNADDSTTVLQVGMCSPYNDGGQWLTTGSCTPWPAGTADPTVDYSTASEIITVPVGTKLAIWNFPGDAHSEIGFTIFAPDGRQLLDVADGTGAPGLLPVTNCL
ncbi:hypothetical protein OD91_2282 [Lutibacter sp. Hel_I_33_5]|uniref:hypothetical protein n=1 Tax=Lutibacter sp. Hel_I_33_5 TaxID=1566289 RepID=UPI00119E7301|nr:hypothetical protein [Lutibacter sp. Hel_I_33_5]TVZ56978.1 hypothetical protein OD91_2282 [Lutibacter sp. Hel_I_33_5]